MKLYNFLSKCGQVDFLYRRSPKQNEIDWNTDLGVNALNTSTMYFENCTAFDTDYIDIRAFDADYIDIPQALINSSEYILYDDALQVVGVANFKPSKQ